MKSLPEKIVDTEFGQIKVLRGPGDQNYIAQNANDDGLKYRGKIYRVFGHFRVDADGNFKPLEGSSRNQVYIHEAGKFQELHDNKTAAIIITLACCNALKTAFSDPEFNRESYKIHKYNEIEERAEEYNRLGNQIYELQQKCQTAYDEFERERKEYDALFGEDFLKSFLDNGNVG